MMCLISAPCVMPFSAAPYLAVEKVEYLVMNLACHALLPPGLGRWRQRLVRADVATGHVMVSSQGRRGCQDFCAGLSPFHAVRADRVKGIARGRRGVSRRPQARSGRAYVPTVSCLRRR